MTLSNHNLSHNKHTKDQWTTNSIKKLQSLNKIPDRKMKEKDVDIADGPVVIIVTETFISTTSRMGST